MCYSAKASFAASAILGLMGVASILKCKNKRFVALSVIPIFFALQQISEGIVWLQNDYEEISKNIFLFFAYTFWPIWIPLSILISEKSAIRRSYLWGLLGIGIATGVTLFQSIFDTPTIFQNVSITYKNPLFLDPMKNIFLSTGYAFATIGSLMTSSLKKIQIFGLFVIISAIVVWLIKFCCFCSLWCFWCALSSVGIYYIISKNQ